MMEDDDNEPDAKSPVIPIMSSHIAAHLLLMHLPKFLTSEEQRHLPERYMELRDHLFFIFQYLYLIFI